MGNTIGSVLSAGFQVDTGFLGAQAFSAYRSNVIRGSGTVDVSIGGGPFGAVETIRLAPNVCGTDTICPGRAPSAPLLRLHAPAQRSP